MKYVINKPLFGPVSPAVVAVTRRAARSFTRTMEQLRAVGDYLSRKPELDSSVLQGGLPFQMAPKNIVGVL